MLQVYLILVFSTSTFADYTLQDYNQEQIDPLHQPESEDSSRDHDKRTIFPTTFTNYGWAKHVGVKHGGMKYVLGYGPVDLKYVPVVRPIALKPMYQFRPIKPKWPTRPIVLKPLLPAVQKPSHHGWKPIYKPPPNKGWDQSILQVPVKPAVVFKPSHSVVNLQPPPVIQVKPPVKPVVPVQPVVPVTPLKPVVPVHPVVPVTPLKPVLPVPIQPAVPVTPLRPVVPVPFIPQQPLQPAPLIPTPLFHVTRPNLPVLPLGSAFPSPLLNLPIAAGIPPRPSLPNVPLGTPNFALPQPLPRPTLIEFHGKQFLFAQQPVPQPPAPIPFAPQAPFVPSIQLPSAPNPFPTYQQSFQGHLPRDNPNVGIEQHDVQTPVVPEGHQQILQQQNNLDQQQYYQQFGLQDNQQQQFETQSYQQAPQAEYLPPVETFRYSDGQQSEPLQQLQQNDNNFIQPGQSDVQIPIHLPNHPHFRPNSFTNIQDNGFQTQNQNLLAPSVGLEPPFRKRRIDKDVQQNNEGEVEEPVRNKHR